MYTLRQIYKNGVEMNQSLGDGYEVVKRDISPKVFNLKVKEIFSDSDIIASPELYAIVISHDGSATYFLYEEQAAYIINENGKTLDNLTY